MRKNAPIRKQEINEIFSFFAECIAPKELGDIDRPEMPRKRLKIIRFHYIGWSNKTALDVYQTFVREVSEVPDMTKERAQKLARTFARMLITTLIVQRDLDEYAHISPQLPYYGFPSVSEILNGEK